jgi:tRNA modification GTPase
MFSTDDTIVAIATPAGRGGIGVVRLSGPDATRVATRLLGRSGLEPRHATFARIRETVDDPASDAAVVLQAGGQTIDHVVVTYFPHPHSYTGEDVVEISGHGSPLLLRRIVEGAMAAGARLAEPGEFTLRAYLNERLDLVQAEAVADLIDAVTPLQARVAMDQLEGTLTGAIGRLDGVLLDLSARLEASLDFPDEGFHFITREEARDAIGRLRADLEALAHEGRKGRLVREGRVVAIVGRPNAGKSSLFNALAGAGRAIVTDIPGTTRDILTERVDIRGLPITLVDTAGLREAGDAIEAEGVARAKQAHRTAALSLIVVDGSTPLTVEDRELVAGSAGARLIVVSKSDLPRRWQAEELPESGDEVLDVSALIGSGLDRLRQRVADVLLGQDDLRDAPAISNARHLSLVDAAAAAVRHAEEALAEGATEELVLIDLTSARRALEDITGRRTPDDVLQHIFARFCVGK